MAYQMAATIVTLNDLECHARSPSALAELFCESGDYKQGNGLC